MDLHYSCGIVLFLSSVTGCLLPFQKRFNVTPVRPFSTGIIFGVALCHLLPDAGENLNTIQVTEWFMTITRLQGSIGDDGLYDVVPVANTLMCLGIFIMLVIDQCIPCPHHQSISPCNSPSRQGGEKTPLLPSTTNSNGNCSSSDSCAAATSNGNAAHDVSANKSHNSTKSNCLGIVPKIPNAKVYATEIAIAIHSIIIGFTMGINPNTSSLIGFTIAMIFHQMFEGVALSMIARQGNLDVRALVVMVFLFSLSLPTGIIIGLIVYRVLDDNDSSTSEDGHLSVSTIMFQGVPNAISAGMLLHIGFELMMEDFNHKLSTFPTQKLLLAFLGGAMFCFIAIWA